MVVVHSYFGSVNFACKLIFGLVWTRLKGAFKKDLCDTAWHKVNLVGHFVDKGILTFWAEGQLVSTAWWLLDMSGRDPETLFPSELRCSNLAFSLETANRWSTWWLKGEKVLFYNT